MGKHHMKKNKKKRPRQTEPPEVTEADLERFAGSSEEENYNDDSDDDDVNDGKVEDNLQEEEEEEIMTKPQKGGKQAKTSRKAVDNDEDIMDRDSDESEKENESEGGDDDDDDGEGDEDEDQEPSTSAMALAMARILGASSKGSTVVLSKTTTPLQREAQKEIDHKKALREKRKLNRTKNLEAMHIPLSVATTLTTPMTNNNNNAGGSKLGIAQELERERMHRRVATRGVVALFNAISQHQQEVRQQNNSGELQVGNTSTTGDSTTKKKVKSLTKHGFLDLIKTTAATSGAGEKGGGEHNNQEAGDSKNEKKNKKAGWKALQEDFMMNSKLKDWDKEIEDDDDDDDESDSDAQAAVADDWSSEEEAPAQSNKKHAKKKTRLQ